MIKSQLRCLFLDNAGGSYLPQALIIAPYFNKMYYHIPQNSGFPSPHFQAIGTGYEGIEVLTSILDKLETFDLVIIPDLYLASYATLFKKMGKLVWGGQLDALEQYRNQFYEIQERLDMDVAPFETITGFKALRKLLKQKKYNGAYAKINYFRGAFETFQYVDENSSEPKLDQIQHDLGPLGDQMVFVVQQPIESKNLVELGYDGFIVNGVISPTGMMGVEAKDAGFLGKFEANFPKPIKDTNLKFAPALASYKATGFYSTEVRADLDNNKNYYIDVCARAGMPPSNVYLSMWDNLSEILIRGAQGQMVTPVKKFKYGCEIILKSQTSVDDFMAVSFPEEFKDNVKLKGSFIKDGQHYITPFKTSANLDMTEFGSVVVVGNDKDEIMQQAKDIASQVKGYGIFYEENVIDKINEEINNLESKINYNF